jgi:crotonobetainyl-CoA:carnitine CoA-transferase CaiB-like acyl-CoA transferase
MASAAFVWQRVDHPEAPGYASWLLDARAPQESFLCSDGRWVHYALPSPRLVLSQRDKTQLSADDDTVSPRRDPDRLQLDIWELAIYCHYYPEMVKIFAQFPSDAWVALGAEVGAPIAPVRSTQEALQDPACLADRTVVDVDDYEMGRTRQAGFAFSLDSHPGTIRGPQPRIGEHTDAVRAEASLHGGISEPQESPGLEEDHPLSGIVVVDLGLAVSAPYGTQVLAQLGASVIKVHAVYDDAGDSNQMIQSTTRGKRSIAVDLKTPAGHEIVCRLVSRADVLQHNMRLGAAERLGLSYMAMSNVNPRLIYSHIRGFETGLRSERPANDQIVAGISGVQWEDGACARGGKPFWALTPMGDVGAGYLSATAVMLGLIARRRTGRGQNLSTSLLNACLLNNSYVCLDEQGRELRQPELDRDHRGVGALEMLYPTASGWICIEAVRPGHWPRLCRAIGRPEIVTDPRFRTAKAREVNRRELARLLESVFVTQPAPVWVERFDRHGVPCEQSLPVTLDDLFDDEELARLRWTSSYVHPTIGRFDQAGLLVELSLTPGRNNMSSPRVGEHTREILTEYGYTDGDIERLGSLGVVAFSQ